MLGKAPLCEPPTPILVSKISYTAAVTANVASTLKCLADAAAPPFVQFDNDCMLSIGPPVMPDVHQYSYLWYNSSLVKMQLVLSVRGPTTHGSGDQILWLNTKGLREGHSVCALASTT